MSDHQPTKLMNAIDLLKYWAKWSMTPHTQEGARVGRPSNAELRRWLTNRAVHINLGRPKPGDKIIFPILELVYFPGRRSQTTVMLDDRIDDPTYWDATLEGAASC